MSESNERYNVFTRTWWRNAGANEHGWPKGLVPCPGKKHYLARNVDYTEARAICERYNSTHNPGRYSRKAEFESL